MQYKNPEIDAIVTAFAKTGKIGKARVVAFLQDLEAQSPKRGKPVGIETAKVREAIQKMAKDKDKREFTAADLAKELGVAPVLVNNTLNWAKAQGIAIENVGKVERAAGQRGKAASIFKMA